MRSFHVKGKRSLHAISFTGNTGFQSDQPTGTVNQEDLLPLPDWHTQMNLLQTNDAAAAEIKLIYRLRGSTDAMFTETTVTKVADLWFYDPAHLPAPILQSEHAHWFVGQIVLLRVGLCSLTLSNITTFSFKLFISNEANLFFF